MQARKVKFGVRIHQGGYSYDALRRIWTEADGLGYHSATLYDLLNVPTLECWTTLSALAAETRSIRLTPLVLANHYRPPALMAKMASTLDVISGGRLELGIGAGGGQADSLASGYSFHTTPIRVAMLEEALEAIIGLWTRTNVDFRGEHYALKGGAQEPRPIQDPYPPILVGGHGERHLLRAAARYADICNIGFEIGLDEHRAKLRILEGHCREYGRDVAEIEVSHNTRVIIAADDAEYRELLAREAARSHTTAEAYSASLAGAIAGPPDRCVEQIRRYVNQGITYFFLLFPDPIPTESLRLFAREVIPHFA